MRSNSLLSSSRLDSRLFKLVLWSRDSLEYLLTRSLKLTREWSREVGLIGRESHQLIRQLELLSCLATLPPLQFLAIDFFANQSDLLHNKGSRIHYTVGCFNLLKLSLACKTASLNPNSVANFSLFTNHCSAEIVSLLICSRL